MSFALKIITLMLFLSVAFVASRVVDLEDISEEAFIKPKISPEFLGSFTEGDNDGEDDLVDDGKRKLGIIYKERRWPNGRVPYKIEGPYSDSIIQMIKEAVRYFHNHTNCVRFVEWNETDPRDHDYIVFKNRNGSCVTLIGYTQGHGAHLVQMSDNCFWHLGIVLHEMMHALGFFDEHKRPDRDRYVKINKNNIMPTNLADFVTMDPRAVTNFSLPYDYESVMHYEEKSFSMNNESTMESIIKDKTLGGNEGLSDLDVAQLNMMYSC